MTANHKQIDGRGGILASQNYSVEWLLNGLIRVFCRASKLTACFNPDGTFRHGDLGHRRWISEEGRSDYLTLEETLSRLDELVGEESWARRLVYRTPKGSRVDRCNAPEIFETRHP